MITRPPLRYLTPDTYTPQFHHLFIFFEIQMKNTKDTHPPMTHPPMFLSNLTKLPGLDKK